MDAPIIPEKHAGTMEERLEKLAISKKRLTATYPDKETVDPNIMFEHESFYEAEDRKNGKFPYDDDSVQTITEFYQGKDILITGGTGFVGKVLIEKILRSLPKGGRIFLLLRGRKGLTPQQRIKSMLELPLFESVLIENPRAAERLVVVEGDCSSLGLGLSKTDRQTIIDNVSIVFHCAATVHFNLPFSFVILVNTRGTREMVLLCKDLKKLDAFVHVSTAYTGATTDRTEPVPEEVLPSGTNWQILIKAAESSSQTSNHTDGFDFIFQKLGSRHPTNYTFSKLLAENLVEEECRGLPAIIVRPSVLLATYEDPFRGWVDNLYGPLSIWDASGRGIIRAHYGDQDLSLDHLPVDFHVKVLISAAWHRGLGFRTSSDPERVDVVNNGTGSYINMSFRMEQSHMGFVCDQATHKYILRYPRIVMTTNYWLFWFITMTSHLPLGILVDTLLKLKGKKPLLLQVYRRIFFAETSLLVFYTTKSFTFRDKWQWTINARMPKADKARFSWMTKAFLFSYSVDNVAGVIKYVFNETPVKREQSNRPIMHIVDWIHTAILVGLGLWIISWMIY